jgi:hypothetical protein
MEISEKFCSVAKTGINISGIQLAKPNLDNPFNIPVPSQPTSPGVPKLTTNLVLSIIVH